MKKLKKLELKDTPKMQDLQSEEMKHFQGGMGTWNEEFGSYMLDEVTVYGDAPGPGPMSECPQCQQYNRVLDHYSKSGGLDYSPLRRYLTNTLPHKMGWGNHQ